MTDQDEQWWHCTDCDLRFTVTANNDAEIMNGEPFVVYCPRCGSPEIEGMIR